MKVTEHLFIAFVLAALTLTACHNDDEKPGFNTLPEGAVHITAGIEEVQTRAPQLDADGAGSFDPADEWGMYTFTGDALSPTYSNENIIHKADNSNPLYWKDLSETEAVTFSAHYPRITETIVNPAAYMYMPQMLNNADDLLHATATASKDGIVALTFKHLMHRLVVNLIVGEGMVGADLSSALINSIGKNGVATMYAGVKVNLLTGAVNYDHVTGSVAFSNGSSGNADWIVTPQELTAGAEWLRIKVGEDTWYYSVPAKLNNNPDHPTRLESGKRLTLNLTLKKDQQTGKTEVELTATEISGWGDGGTITDEVAIGGAASGVTTYEALLAALKTGGTSADAPTLVTLGSDITIPAGGDNDTPPINGSGYFKIDGGGHTMTWENGSYYFLGNTNDGDDVVHIEFTNIKLDQDANSVLSSVFVRNGRITLGKGVALNGRRVIRADGEKTALELGDGCELSDATSSSSGCAIVANGAILVLNGGKTATGTYIALSSNSLPVVSHSLISVPKALTGSVYLFFELTGITSIARGTGSYQLTQADCDRLIVELGSTVSLYGEWMRRYNDIFELYLDPAADYQIKLRPKNFTPPTSGHIDMTSMTADVAQITIRAALAAGYTEVRLTGELSKIGMDYGNWGTFYGNTQITKCDLTGVTDWGATPTLPDRAFMNSIALQEVTLPDDVQIIGDYAFSQCAALTTVNLSQVTQIDKYVFWECTSLETLTLDNVTAIGRDAFYGCTGLETLKMPKCTRFGAYIVTGCKALTRIEATAARDFVHIDENNSIETYPVFRNRGTHSGENAFNSTNCDLVLNADKQPDTGVALPKATTNGEWTIGADARPMKWNSITFQQ